MESYSMRTTCRFCEIINFDGERTDEEVAYEDSDFLVVTDKFRKTSAGLICLIIPKIHKSNLLEINEGLHEKLMKIIILISRSMQAAYECKGVRIWTAINKEAGQSIFHCHIHLVPCNSVKDRFIALFPGVYDTIRGIVFFGRKELSKEINFKLATKLRNEIEATR